MKKKHLFLFLLLFSMMILGGYKADVSAKIIYTTNAKVNAAAEKIIKSCTKPNMTSEQKLRQVYLYLVKNMRYSYHTGPVRIKVSNQEIKNISNYAKKLQKQGKLTYSSAFKRRYNNTLSMQGTCYGMSMVFCILANHLGYGAKMCHGRYITSPRRTSDHYWCYVVMKGKKYYFDVQIANYYWKKTHSMKYVENYYKKLKNSAIWKRYHRGGA